MKILTTALYSFIIEVLWILNTVRYNWSLSYTHPHFRFKTLTRIKLISYKSWRKIQQWRYFGTSKYREMETKLVPSWTVSVENKFEVYRLGCPKISFFSRIEPVFLYGMCIGHTRSHAKFQTSGLNILKWRPLFVNGSWPSRKSFKMTWKLIFWPCHP